MSHSVRLLQLRPGLPPPHIRGGEEVRDCLAIPRIGEEVPDLELGFHPPGLLHSFAPRTSY